MISADDLLAGLVDPDVLLQCGKCTVKDLDAKAKQIKGNRWEGNINFLYLLACTYNVPIH